MSRGLNLQPRHPGFRKWLATIATLLLLFTALPIDVITPAIAQSDGQSFELAVRKFDCPQGFDAYSGNGLFENCTTAQPGIDFSLTTDDGSYQGDTRTTGDDGGSQVSWSNVPLNTTFTLQESIPAGYDLPFIVCRAYAAPWDGNSGVADPDFTYGQGSISAHLDLSWADYPYINCYWFNVPLPDDQNGDNGGYNADEAQPGSIEIRKYTCWLDYDQNNPVPAYDYLSNQCSPGYPGARMQLQYGSNTWQDFSLNQEGIGSYSQYNGGDFRLRELEPWPHPVSSVVYCSTGDDQGNYGQYDNSYQEGKEVRGQLPAGYGLTCDWFNVFYPAIHVVKYQCDDESDYRQSDIEDLLQHCAPKAGTDFDLLNAVATTQTTGNDGRFSYYFTMDEDSEPVTIEEQVESGYPYVRIFCSTAQRGEYPDQWEEKQTSDPGYYQYEHDKYAQVSCAFFNIPDYQNGDQEYGTITIYKYVCPIDYDSSSDDYQTYVDNCDEQQDVEYRIADSNNYDESQAVGSSGYAQWDKSVPYGPLTITEYPAAGYATWRVYCGDYQDDPSEVSSYDPVNPYEANSIEWNLAEGYNLTCHWFNIPYEEKYVYITKYVCPPDYWTSGPQPPVDDWRTACTETHQGASFYATYNGALYGPEESGPSGEVELPRYPGNGRLYEQYLPGYRAAYVACSQDGFPDEGIYGGEPDVDAQSSDYWVDLGDFSTVENAYCEWFNVPVEVEYGRVTIHKYVCPPNWDYTSADLPGFADNCVDPYSTGFSVTYSGGDDSTSTSDLGTAVFDNVVPGQITLTEAGVSGYRSIAVYCHEVEYGTVNNVLIDYEQRPLSGNEVGYELRSGYELDCYWFNQEYEDLYGTITIYKYECPVDYDGSSTYHQDYVDNCFEQDGMEYELYASDDYEEIQTVGNSAYAQWDKTVPYGPLTLRERAPSGYKTWRVFCGTYVDDPSEVSSYDQVNYYDGNSIDWDLDEGYNLICYWFNQEYEDFYGTVTIYKYECPVDYDGSSTYHQDYVDDCFEQDGMEYELFASDDYEEIQAVGSSAYAQWDKTVPYGPLTLRERAPSGYKTWRVFCGTYVDDPSEVSSYDQVDFYDGNSIDWDLDEGYNLICYWFNQPSDYSTITIYKYVCDDGYDHQSLGLDYLRTYCDEPYADIEFELTHGSPEAVESHTTDQSGVAEWGNVSAGDIKLLEYAPQGYAPLRVYCAEVPTGSAETGDYESVPYTTGGRVDYTVRSGYDLTCYWFNAPYEDEDGWVTIYKYVCPDGYDASNLSREYLESYCTDPYADIDFDLSYDDDSPESLSTGDDGVVRWEKVPSGNLRIEEAIVSGYTTVGIYCTAYPKDGAPGEREGVEIQSGRAMEYELPSGYSLSCYWYNAPYEDENGVVTIYKYVCPEGYDYDSISREYLESYCQEAQQDVRFALYNQSGEIEQSGDVIPYDLGEVDPVYTSQSGELKYDQVYGGGLELREYPPDGYETLRVYCSAYPSSGNAGDYDQMAVSDGSSIYYDLTPGYSLTCYWYNTPVKGGWVEITKYACPDDYDPVHATVDEIDYACGDRMEDVEFAWGDAYGDPEGSGSTDESGKITFKDIPYGAHYDLWENYPDGYASSIIFCARYDPYLGSVGEYDRYGGTIGGISVELKPGEYLVCRWYNLPTRYGATIKIVKYACPDAAWEDSYDELNSESNGCDVQPHVRFTVRSGAVGIEGSTDSAGIVRWDSVPTGLISIEETPPEGYGNRAKIICDYGSNADRSGIEHTETTNEGNTFEHWMGDGYILECTWFNFPVDEDGGKVVVTKFLCPAGADSHSTSRTSLKSSCAPLKGVRFSLAGSEGAAQTRVTGQGGVATWEGVAEGEIGIAERTLQGYRTPIVYCSVDGDPWDRMAVTGVSIELDIRSGYEIRCEWFNLPKSQSTGGGYTGGNTGGQTGGQTGGNTGNQGGVVNEGPVEDGPATLTIVKYTCPAGYDLNDRTADPENECEEFTEEISFSLANWSPGGSANNGDSGSEVIEESREPLINVVTFAEVEAGDYLVTELPPNGSDIAYAFVLNCDSSLGELDSSRFYPLALTRDNLSLRLKLFAGEELTCSWYNVPAGANELLLTINTCPGRVANPARCQLADEPVTLFLYPSEDPESSIKVTSGADGTAAIEVPAGTYEVDNSEGTVCLIDSAATDDDGNLLIEGDASHEATIYTCSS